MARLKLDTDILGISSIIERLTGAHVKDCFQDEDFGTLYVVVGAGELGKAVGKGGETVRRLEQQLGKHLRIIEFRDTATAFVQNVIYPLTVAEIAEQDRIMTLRDPSKKTKSLLIGREGRHLKLITRAVRRFFNIEEIKVI
ncbi:NusA-like transcription termination signal-binding factor [Candidatus Woesearchaeota archaeon]|nr:NusA-like transcription termination signal-binding factor [Candidatus Woesearchaeota archaeon]